MINPTPYVEARIEKLKEKMVERNLDAVIIARPENVFYFSNFNPIISSHPAFVLISCPSGPSPF